MTTLQEANLAEYGMKLEQENEKMQATIAQQKEEIERLKEREDKLACAMRVELSQKDEEYRMLREALTEARQSLGKSESMRWNEQAELSATQAQEVEEQEVLALAKECGATYIGEFDKLITVTLSGHICFDDLKSLFTFASKLRSPESDVDQATRQ